MCYIEKLIKNKYNLFIFIKLSLFHFFLSFSFSLSFYLVKLRKKSIKTMYFIYILMSSSRSVAAAQRRRAGPSETQSSRGPNTSIQSSQAFSQPPQVRPGTSGRLAGQHAALSQQQQMQQQQQNMNNNSNTVSTSKMTVPQAITLITLRLGKLENQMQNLEGLSLSELGTEPGSTGTQDNTIITSLLDRVNALEQKSGETLTLKQQVDVLKTALVATKNATTISSKEIKELKPLLEQLQQEIVTLKQQMEELYIQGDELVQEQSELIEGELESENEVQGLELKEEESEEQVNTETIDLKSIIEQDLNAATSC